MILPTKFTKMCYQFHMWLNLISWIANCNNFMNLLNQFHYMCGPCSWNFHFAQNLFLAFQCWMSMAYCFHRYICNDDALHSRIIHSIFYDSLFYFDTSKYYGYPYETIKNNSITFEESSQSMPNLEVVFVI